LLLALSPAISSATYPGANGRIAFAGYPGPYATDNDIYTVLPSGSAVRQLTDNSVGDFDPSWSADGQRLAFVSIASGRYQVFTMRADGGNRVRVTHDNGDDDSPGFSPNGRRIVYAKDHRRRISIFKIRTDGTDKRLLFQGGYVTSPRYSPNGKRIVFEGIPKHRQSHGYAIWTIHSDGSHLRRLTDPGDSHYDFDEYPDWSPDGSHIAFFRCIESTHSCDGDIYLMRSDGFYEHAINRVSGENPPAFSPGGGRIALTGYFSEELCSDIYTIPLTGSPSHLVTHNCEDINNGGPGGFAAQPSWQPIPQP